MTNRFRKMVVSASHNPTANEGFNAKSEDVLRTIVVAGVASKAGKTSLAEAVTRILAQAVPIGAAKITVTHGERGCPHGGKGCNVCSSLGGEYQVTQNPSIIAQEGTDTARLQAAGGNPVLWTITRVEYILDAWEEMQAKMKDVFYAVIESNTLAVVTRPTMTLMIVDPTVSRRLWKPSAEQLIATADLVIFNDRGTEERKHATHKEIENLRGTTDDIVRLSHPAEAKENNRIVRMLLKHVKR